MKLKRYVNDNGNEMYQFYCPGCECFHLFDVKKDGTRPNWSFNGDMERPTFNPSLLYPTRICHLFLHDGILDFQGDCTHKLAGQKIPLPDLPEGGVL